MLLRNLKSQAIFDKANAELAFIRTNEINVAHFQGKLPRAVETLY
jgi:DNA processing protein